MTDTRNWVFSSGDPNFLKDPSTRRYFVTDILDAENEYRTLTPRLAALERVAEAARAIRVWHDAYVYELHPVPMMDALRAALDALPEAQGEASSPHGIGKNHIQIVGATEAQVDAFNADPAGPWIVYFVAPCKATAQMRVTMQMHPVMRQTTPAPSAGNPEVKP